MNRALETMGRRLKQARLARKLSQVQLGQAVDMGQSNISKLEKGGVTSTTGIARLAHAIGVSPQWLEFGYGPVPDFLTSNDVPASEPPPPFVTGGGLTLVNSLRQTPGRMTWDQLESTFPLPAEFEVELPDHAMATAPIPCPAGTVCTFRHASAPVAGEAMLVRDKRGRTYFRECRLHADGTWSAYAYNAAFPTLSFTADQLEVVAVFDGLRARWSDLAR